MHVTPVSSAVTSRAADELLLIANPRTSGASAELVDAARRRLGNGRVVGAVVTDGQGHAEELARAAAEDGVGCVVVLGGDGTVNEAANGLAGSATALACVPTGCTNVFARTIGMPRDPAAALRRLDEALREPRPLRVDTGLVNGRRFLFAVGIGITALVMERADRRQAVKARLRGCYFAYATASALAQHASRMPSVRVTVAGRSLEGVTVVVQNSDPLTYFGGRAIRACGAAGLSSGGLSLAVAGRGGGMVAAGVLVRLLSGDAARVTAHQAVSVVDDLQHAEIAAVDGPFALEADGTYLGHVRCAEVRIEPRSLSVVA